MTILRLSDPSDVALPEFLGPVTFYFEDWTFDGNAFEGSQRLEVQVVK